MIELPALRRSIRFFRRATWITIGLVLGLAMLPQTPDGQIDRFIYVPAATAQRIQIDQVWQQVYQQLPDFPLENQYINKETGDVSSNNTLVSRLIRYHIYIKGRPTNYRLDWKLTLADYLGVNERIDEDTYPSGTALRTNPMQGDVVAIQSLTRVQRDALVNTLVGLLNPKATDPATTAPPIVNPNPSPEPSLQPSPSPSPQPSRFPRQPQPGDAQLLQP